MFLCAFIYASFVFFAWQFGNGSCPFKDGFYTGWVLPWYTILIANTLIFFHMAIVTLPTYSLCVLMGSDVKAHMLPKKFAKKLLAVASVAKEKVKAEKDAAAAAAGAGGGGKMNGAGGSTGFLNSLTVGRKTVQFTTDSSEISKEAAEEEGDATTPASAAAATHNDDDDDVDGPSSPTAIAAAAAAARSKNLPPVDLAPARSGAVAPKSSKFDKAVSLITRRLVGEHHDGKH